MPGAAAAGPASLACAATASFSCPSPERARLPLALDI